jgi:hypothetical protein
MVIMTLQPKELFFSDMLCKANAVANGNVDRGHNVVDTATFVASKHIWNMGFQLVPRPSMAPKL